MKGKNRISHESEFVVCFFCPLSSLNKNTEISFWQTIKIEWCVIFVFRMPIEMPEKTPKIPWKVQLNQRSTVWFYFDVDFLLHVLFSSLCVSVCVRALHVRFVRIEKRVHWYHYESNREVCILFIRIHKHTKNSAMHLHWPLSVLRSCSF